MRKEGRGLFLCYQMLGDEVWRIDRSGRVEEECVIVSDYGVAGVFLVF